MTLLTICFSLSSELIVVGGNLDAYLLYPRVLARSFFFSWSRTTPFPSLPVSMLHPYIWVIARPRSTKNTYFLTPLSDEITSVFNLVLQSVPLLGDSREGQRLSRKQLQEIFQFVETNLKPTDSLGRITFILSYRNKGIGTGHLQSTIGTRKVDPLPPLSIV